MIMMAKERAGVLRRLIDRMYPDESKEWKEAHLRSWLETPDQKQHVSKPVRAAVPVRKSVPILIRKNGKIAPSAYEKLSKDVGPDVARMLMGMYEGDQIQYR